MILKSNKFSLKNFNVLAVALTLLISIIGVNWWKHEQSQQNKLQSLERELEQKRISLVLRQAGIAATKIQQSQAKANHVKYGMEEDELAPHELSDEEELAQAKLWLSLPKDKRAIMRTDTINAGLAAAKKMQHSPY